jgi:two-component system LytT family response regulator
MRKIKVLVIDDERAARVEIRRLLENYPEFEVLGEAANADEAKDLIESTQPDVLFLDIQMPGKSGFELLESLISVPQVVFITAYDEYAVRAFEVSALDYLMKPVREERFAKAVTQLKLALPVRDERFFVKDRGRYHHVSWQNVHLITSLDNYSRLYFEDKNVFLKSSLNQLEAKLDPAVFFRINRAQMINLSYIEKISTAPKGRIMISLVTGDQLEVSHRRSVRFKNRQQIN